MSRKIQRKKIILLSMYVVFLIYLIPLSISGPVYWDVQTGFWWNSDPNGNDGQFQFSGDSSFQSQVWTLGTFSPGNTHNFTEFRQVARGDTWREARLGFNIDPQSNGTLVLVDSDEIQIRIERTGIVTSTSYLLIPGRDQPISVTFNTSGTWTWNDTAKIIQIKPNHLSSVLVTISWGATQTQQIFAGVFSGWTMASLLILVAAFSYLYMILSGQEFEVGGLITIILTAVMLAVGLIIVSAIYNILP